MTPEHWSFLKHSDTSFGFFYPRDYTMAGFPDMASAQQAESALREAGFAADDVRAVPGDFVAKELENPEEPGLLDRIKRKIAEIAGTEEGYVEDDVALAERGGAFVFVHTPDDDTAQRAEAVLRDHDPVFARRYLALAIERVIEKDSPSTH